MTKPRTMRESERSTKKVKVFGCSARASWTYNM